MLSDRSNMDFHAYGLPPGMISTLIAPPSQNSCDTILTHFRLSSGNM